jgi:hypothetical protein
MTQSTLTLASGIQSSGEAAQSCKTENTRKARRAHLVPSGNPSNRPLRTLQTAKDVRS